MPANGRQPARPHGLPPRNSRRRTRSTNQRLSHADAGSVFSWGGPQGIGKTAPANDRLLFYLAECALGPLGFRPNRGPTILLTRWGVFILAHAGLGPARSAGRVVGQAN